MDEIAIGLQTLVIHGWRMPNWSGLHPPNREGGDWGITLPNGLYLTHFETAFPNVQTNGWRTISGDARATYLVNWTDEVVAEIQRFFEVLLNCVVIEDQTDGSFSLDFRAEYIEQEDEWHRTVTGALVYRAKPYQGPARDTHRAAAAELAQRMVEAVRANPCMEPDAIVAVPSSNPDSEYKLPEVLAVAMAEELGVPFLRDALVKVRATPSIKGLARTEKLEALSGSIEVRENVDGRRLLVVDDLYQSGVTLNYAAGLLKHAGAANVHGLTGVKTMRNDDNTARTEEE